MYNIWKNIKIYKKIQNLCQIFKKSYILPGQWQVKLQRSENGGAHENFDLFRYQNVKLIKIGDIWQILLLFLLMWNMYNIMFLLPIKIGNIYMFDEEISLNCKW